jgi:peptidoglycan/xylan/chitin deacetylase (PgdA/CDA1 family)
VPDYLPDAVRRRVSIPVWKADVNSHTLFTTSWDDGHPLDERIADTLEEFGFVGTFYASTGPEGRRLISDNALTRIGRIHELGVHGRTHTIFPELSRQALAEEIHWAVDELSRFGKVGRVVAPPRGKIDGATRRFIGQLGFAVRTGAIIGAAAVRGNSLDPTFQLYPHVRKTIIRNCLYRRRIPTMTILLELAREGELRERSRRLLLAAARRQRYVHVWGHAADVERLDLWKALRGLLGMAADLGLAGVSNSEAFDRLSQKKVAEA